VERDSWAKVREIAYYSLVAPHSNPKALPKSKEQFMPLYPKDTTSRTAKPEAIQFLKKQIQEYNELKKAT
jgi:hypothetical protein